MRNLVLVAILGILVLLQSGCAAGVAVTRPRLPTIVIGEAEPAPAPPPPRHEPVRRHEPAPRRLSRGEAIALGQSWCRSNGFHCALDDADLKRRGSIWQLKFDAVGPHRHGPHHYRGKAHGRHHRDERGRVRLEIDAWTGRILDSDVRF